ncbi:MAG TPA: CBS and ACT domain-containing protein [Longimicrobiaceae bacterium]
MLVQDRMRPRPITVTPDDTLADALRLTREHRIRHLPVVLPTGELTGIVSDRDIRLAMPSPLTVSDDERAGFLLSTPIAAIMTREVITASPMETIEDAARTMYRHRISSLPIVNARGDLQGILTETDILHAFVQLLGGMQPCSRIEVVLADRPGELARAIRVVGEQLQLNIVSLLVPSARTGEPRVAIINLATIDPRDAVEALETAGFRVGWPALERDLRTAPEPGA